MGVITGGAFYVNPIRGLGNSANQAGLIYNLNSKEVTYSTSSIKYKINVIDLQEDTSAILNVKAREYDTKEDNIHNIGYIAEELNNLNTNFTWKNSDGTPEGINWNNLSVFAIEEIKRLRNDVTLLTQQNQDIMQRLSYLENKI